jgi:arsenate reductase (glutaredoxin)
LTQKGVEFETVNYIDKPLTADELKRILRAAKLKPADAMRTGEDAYKNLVAGKKLSDDELIGIMAAHPEIIQRPLVTKGGKAVLARPAENLRELGL